MGGTQPDAPPGDFVVRVYTDLIASRACMLKGCTDLIASRECMLEGSTHSRNVEMVSRILGGLFQALNGVNITTFGFFLYWDRMFCMPGPSSATIHFAVHTGGGA